MLAGDISLKWQQIFSLCLSVSLSLYIYFAIYMLARTSQTLSLSLSLSLTIRLYHLYLPTGPLDNILCPYWAVEDKFLLVGLHLHVCVKGPLENVAYEFSGFCLE